LPSLLIIISIILSSTSAFAYRIPEQDQKEVADILYGEGANDAGGWLAKLNTYYKVRRNRESLLDSMKRVCSAYRTNSKEYQKAKYKLLNAYEYRVYNEIRKAVRDFNSDDSWQYVHHENISAFYETKEIAIKHLKEQWGNSVDYVNTKKIGLETYFKRKK
jgi:hypothetical protein